jgi:hypothetical protein
MRLFKITIGIVGLKSTIEDEEPGLDWEMKTYGNAKVKSGLKNWKN